MWANQVAPAILALLGPTRRVIAQRQLRCFGAGESEIEGLLPDLIQRGRDPTVGITASRATITLRITAVGETAQACRAKIEPTVATIRACLGTLVYGEGNDELQDAVSCLLADRGATLATVEWGTAGLVASALGEVPGIALYYRGGVVIRDYASLARLLDITVNTSRGQAGDPASLAARMAIAVCDRCEADYGLAVGPFPRVDPATTPPPQVHVAVARRGRVHVEPFVFAAHPDLQRTRCAKQALNLLRLTMLDQRLETTRRSE
jgi:nicotinamide-nucleotide amidase